MFTYETRAHGAGSCFEIPLFCVIFCSTSTSVLVLSREEDSRGNIG